MDAFKLAKYSWKKMKVDLNERIFIDGRPSFPIITVHLYMK